MNKPAVLLCCLAAAVAGRADDWLDRVDDSLTWTADHERVRARLSGLAELEFYDFSDPAPGLLHADGGSLVTPRLTAFLDAQLGPRVYVFAQGRVDRGFDPGEGGAQARFDEYAVRFTPSDHGAFSLQLGKFATVVGNWVARHHSWSNPFITAPLPYENPTGIFDAAAADSAARLVSWARPGPAIGGAEDYFSQYRVPVLWGPSYASGASVSGAAGRFDYALEFKNASLSSRPAVWDAAQVQWQHPTVSGRIGFQPDESWSFGVSGSAGSYLTAAARPTLAPGTTLDDYREVVWGQDVAFAWHHFQFWAEAYEAAFEIPRVGRAETVAWYLEAKYKFTPQFSGAIRWNQQLFGSVPNGAGRAVDWGRDTWRIDVAPAFRFTPHTELKLQYSLQFGAIGHASYSHLTAAQFVLRF
ncbi:MAG TPA: hypothetical protein VHD61_03290 [Lacunisphaera sp.]|nr:hypothetical protein [Lacunisphaera sp.]